MQGEESGSERYFFVEFRQESTIFLSSTAELAGHVIELAWPTREMPDAQPFPANRKATSLQM